MANFVSRQNIDLIHIHCGHDLAIAAMAKYFSRRPVRLIYTRQMSLSRSKRDIYHRVMYRQVDRFLTITRELHDQAVRNLSMPKEKIELLYYGVPGGEPVAEASCNAFFSNCGVKKGSFKIGLFGRIEYGKGQHILVEAVKNLTERGRDVEAVFIGHIQDSNYFESLMKNVENMGLSDRIHYYGFHKHPMEVMGCFDVNVLLTKKETFGLVLIEAMRAGSAVIGTDAGGVREIIDDGKTGLLVRPHDAESLANALERLIENPSFRANIARAGKEKADSVFSEERHLRELERIYESVMADR